MKILNLILLLFIVVNNVKSQDFIDVVETTFKVGMMGEEEFYYGFAEGDVLVFNFEEKEGKELKEIEIIELPSSTKFADFKSSSVIDKRIKIQNTGVYKFRFNNGSVKPRICTLKLQRIPANEETKNFNTNWEWKTKFDTIITPYNEDVVVGYDTIRTPYTKSEFIRTDTLYQEIQSNENEIWVHSGGNVSACLGKSASCTKQLITLKYHPETDVLLIWVGVGQETRESYNSLSKELASTAVKTYASYLSGGSNLLVTSFLDELSNEAIENLPTSKNTLDIFLANNSTAKQWFNDYQTDMYDYAYKDLAYKSRTNLKITLDKSLEQIVPNEMTLCLKNNSKLIGTEAFIQVVGIRYVKIYEDKEYIEITTKPKYETVTKQKVEVKSSQIRVNSN